MVLQLLTITITYAIPLLGIGFNYTRDNF